MPGVTSKPTPIALLASAGVLALGACGSGSAQASSQTTPRAAPAPTPHATRHGPVYTFGVVGNDGKIAPLEHRRPSPVDGIRGVVVQIATSNSDGYALTAGGTVWAWGVASAGELGNGTTAQYSARAVRVQFPAGVQIARLANPMPFDGALAIDTQGHAWGWGLDPHGDLCLSPQRELRPAELPLNDVSLATGARSHSLFYSHRTVYACGNGQGGVLGTGSTASSASPVRVLGLPHVRVTALMSSWEGSGALLQNGSYYDWGYNAQGQLGDGTRTNSSLPVQVQLPAAVTQVFQGGSTRHNGQTIALLSNGALWAWGAGSYGQLGDGTRANSSIPVQVKVPSGVRFVSVDSGGFASYAITSADRLWAWGGNQDGQLGTGGKPIRLDTPRRTRIRLTQVSSTAANVVGLAGL